MENEVKQRLKTYLDSQRITQLAFCKALGVSSGYISSMRKSISPDKLSSIAANYPNLNITWLLTGQGPMLNDENVSSANVSAEKSVVNTGDHAKINYNQEDQGDSFWKGLVTELRERIAELKEKCDEKERQYQETAKLLDQAREENERLKNL